MTTDEQIKKGVSDFEQRVADITPETVDTDEASDLSRLGRAADRVLLMNKGWDNLSQRPVGKAGEPHSLPDREQRGSDLTVSGVCARRNDDGLGY